jgi:hypothetical protein
MHTAKSTRFGPSTVELPLANSQLSRLLSPVPSISSSFSSQSWVSYSHSQLHHPSLPLPLSVHPIRADEKGSIAKLC